LPSLAIPATLHGSLLARLDRLAPVRDVAQIGATLGRQYGLISAIASMPQPQLDGALTRLVGAELVYRRGVPPDAEYTVKHALVQDAAYLSMLKSRRAHLHARIADVLESSSRTCRRGARDARPASRCGSPGLGGPYRIGSPPDDVLSSDRR